MSDDRLSASRWVRGLSRCRQLLVLAAWVLLWPIVGRAQLLVSVRPETDGSVALSWNDQGSNFAYRVESRPVVGAGAWEPCAPSDQWPIRATSWREAQPASGEPRLYRVVAVADASPSRGQVVSTATVTVASKTEIAQFLALASAPISPETGVRVLKVVYRTVDAQGNATLASGALFLPDTIGKALPLVSYQHGTSVLKSDVPSNLNSEAVIGLAFGATGYAALMPDYLGMGESPGLHPYHHANTEAIAVVDFLRAARAYCAAQALPLNGQLFLAGYSQGGHATMAAHREIERNYAEEFPLTAVAPMAGAYDLSGTILRDFLSDRTVPNPYYAAYLAMGLRAGYQWTNELSQFLIAPYDRDLPLYFDGLHDGGQINAHLPGQPKRMFTASFLASLSDGSPNGFRDALRDNDVYRWTPRAPVTLYHCDADRDVPYANSVVAYEYFQAHGAAQVRFVNPKPGGDHGAGALPSLLAAKSWFDSLRQ